jgi:exonuclease SbcC
LDANLEPIDEALRRMAEEVTTNIRKVEGRQAIRRSIVELQRSIDEFRSDLDDREGRLRIAASLKAELTVALAQAQGRRDELKSLNGVAVSTRGRIIRQVFNEALNSMWRDLFVRLAPNEQFVPAFSIPETTRGNVRAQLTTRHILGGNGGNPGATLSAGNLNTAALTLFLALHLMAGERVPWVVLDDPVQSMDEIHVAQFAALLRTLSKEHHRRVIVAVHERPLFEYLSLELSPAYEGDRLITVEVSKNAEAETSVSTATRTWRPDPVHEVA